MSVQRKVKARAKRRALRVRRRIRGLSSLPRVSVFRSLNNLYAQVIDDAQGKTIASCSSLALKNTTGDKTAVARSVGRELAVRAQEKGVNAVVLDRGRFLFHGRIKAFAEGLKEGGIKL